MPETPKKETISDFESLANVAQTFLDTPDYTQLVQKVVDSVLHEIGKLGHNFHVAVLALVNKEEGVLERISISRTKPSDDIQSASETKFKDIRTPLYAKENYCIRAMNERRHFLTHSFIDILHPPFSAVECEELQVAGQIKTSAVFPVYVKNKPIGIIIFSTQQLFDELTEREVTFINSLANIIGIAVENSNLFKELEVEKSALENANLRLQQLDKLKDDFLSIASHELRTPMTVIKSYLWMVQQELEDQLNEEQMKYIERASLATQKLINLVNDMLNVSRLEQGRVNFVLQKLNICRTIQDALTGFELQAVEKGIEVKLEEGCDEVFVKADESKIGEVITNLVGNALKFTEEGGVYVSAEDEGDRVKINVRDTGAGISDEDQRKLFKKFERLDNSYKKVAATGGTGLGLYIVKLYVNGMGGEIGAYSDGVGKGTTFWFTLPKIDENAGDLENSFQQSEQEVDVLGQEASDGEEKINSLAAEKVDSIA